MQVYTLTMLMAGVPPKLVAEQKPYLSNMLGLVRGNIYYNLMNWYRCLSCVPVGDTSKFMDTMLGVKQVKSARVCMWDKCHSLTGFHYGEGGIYPLPLYTHTHIHTYTPLAERL